MNKLYRENGVMEGEDEIDRQKFNHHSLPSISLAAKNEALERSLVPVQEQFPVRRNLTLTPNQPTIDSLLLSCGWLPPQALVLEK
jgi:hypothetical protein